MHAPSVMLTIRVRVRIRITLVFMLMISDRVTYFFRMLHLIMLAHYCRNGTE